jgi:hypothetical protein
MMMTDRQTDRQVVTGVAKVLKFKSESAKAACTDDGIH